MHAPIGSRLAVAAVALATLLSACQGRTASAGTAERHVRSKDLAKLQIGHSAPQDVENLFGKADDREPDGSLVYRSSRETATFRFENGVLAKICRTRS
ncbi:MAG TPA: hypothetical protein VFD92_02160 [Candidatus Binatia bacterium]|nr:hypothetical protein [Candidatus Binatia bacterium]